MKNKIITLVSAICFMLLLSENIFANVRYLRLAYRDDPSTTIVIGWSNDGTSTNAQVYYGDTDLGTAWDTYPNSHGIDTITSYRNLTNNFSRITGLKHPKISFCSKQ